MHISVLGRRVLSSTITSLLIHPFSFLLSILWYEPTRDGEQRALPFALVTTVDLLALSIFLFQRQIGRWHDILTSDVEQGHLKAGDIDDVSVTLVDQGNEQVEHRDFGARPETLQSEIHPYQLMQESGYGINVINGSRSNVDSSISIETVRLNPQSVVGRFGEPAAGGRGFDQGLESGGRFAGVEVDMRGPSNVGWGTGMIQPVSESQGMDEGRADLELLQQQRQQQQQQQSGFVIDLGVDISSDSKFKIIHPPVGTPATIYSNIHPALRPKFDNTSRPKQAHSPTGTGVIEPNQI